MATVVLSILNEDLEVVPQGLLRSVRETHGDEAELVQLYSFLCSVQALAWQKKPCCTLTLENVRPGAVLPVGGGGFDVPLLPSGGGVEVKVEGREEPQECGEGEVVAGLTPKKYKAVGAWVHVGGKGTVLMQTKGEVTKFDIVETLDPAECASVFDAMTGPGIEHVMARELVTTEQVGDGEHAPGGCMLLHRDNAVEAMGPVFGPMFLYLHDKSGGDRRQGYYSWY